MDELDAVAVARACRQEIPGVTNVEMLMGRDPETDAVTLHFRLDTTEAPSVVVPAEQRLNERLAELVPMQLRDRYSIGYRFLERKGSESS